MLGFTVRPLEGGGEGLQPNPLDLSTLQGKIEQARLLRVWVEISAWLSEYLRRNGALPSFALFVVHITHGAI